MLRRAMIHSPYLFERIHFFLQRLKSYTGMPLTNESMELLGKTMAELISTLALSTKAIMMTDRRISEFIQSSCFFLADYGSENILKRLMARGALTIRYAYKGGAFYGDGEEPGGYTST